MGGGVVSHFQMLCFDAYASPSRTIVSPKSSQRIMIHIWKALLKTFSIGQETLFKKCSTTHILLWLCLIVYAYKYSLKYTNISGSIRNEKNDEIRKLIVSKCPYSDASGIDNPFSQNSLHNVEVQTSFICTCVPCNNFSLSWNFICRRSSDCLLISCIPSTELLSVISFS